MSKKRIHAIISGKVQGVFFRYYTKRLADELELTGWVTNLPNGSVEVVAEGDDHQLKKFISFLRKGPKLSRVDKIKIEEEKYTENLREFKIIY